MAEQLELPFETQPVNIIKKVVFCTLSFEGVHNWETCPIDEVSYLRSKHRHIFNIEARKEVSHLNRDIEFIVLKHQIQRYLNRRYDEFDFDSGTKDLGNTSCEMLAEDLLYLFDLCYVKVDEDGENGAILIRKDTNF